MSKPYTRPMPRDWWNKNSAFRLFMLRELSSVFVALFALELLCFVSQVGQGEEAMNQFIKSLGNPFLLVFHAVVLAFALLHSITWFNLSPKAMVVRLGDWRVPDLMIAGGNYAGWFLISAVIAAAYILG